MVRLACAYKFDNWVVCILCMYAFVISLYLLMCKMPSVPAFLLLVSAQNGTSTTVILSGVFIWLAVDAFQHACKRFLPLSSLPAGE